MSCWKTESFAWFGPVINYSNVANGLVVARFVVLIYFLFQFKSIDVISQKVVINLESTEEFMMDIFLSFSGSI